MRDLSGVVAGYSTMKIVWTANVEVIGINCAAKDVDVSEWMHCSGSVLLFGVIERRNKGKTGPPSLKLRRDRPAESKLAAKRVVRRCRSAFAKATARQSSLRLRR